MSIARVQSKTANTGASTATSLTVTFDANLTVGNLVVIACGSNGQTPNVTSDANITWLQAVAVVTANGTFQNMFVGRVLGATAAVTISVGTATTIAAVGAEYSGLSFAFDRGIDATGTSTSPATGATGTTSSANQLWIAGITARQTNGVTFSSPTNSFSIVGQTSTSLATTADRSVALLERIVSSTGTANAGATISSSSVWVAQVRTFQEAAGGFVIGG